MHSAKKDTFTLCLSAGDLKSQMSTLSTAHKEIITWWNAFVAWQDKM